ncbi:MarR family winged helix-turn-helix transcriptional regulator [Aliarcobacter butzleri]|uniref:MarR family winged helix-turn-helix transcriptional regulator n=1 Tax=Aliarcobacter butzleri TaxID=28197 RepID=UPI001EDC16E0|nr:MarR family winged helix-turn-helix transcriptional regulator [Aliarcobacter butzleri]MCG3657320.1 MarR family winged helix-turn-helix transcriptional regulator [Aliarcobacter butzleri]MCG3680767.1 MarR family winged helix-turn-helix transcriptional regulator [Aliarcobacter butzleri]MCG3709903.1 MarR family winged helix-turn-helix transcriptional regulator [Aliarcobacter butzleri]MCG3714403.1 MarR family winged helix-turn-helix transcriptional regulator [Aliarcobacter butzleri]MDN5067154.1 
MESKKISICHCTNMRQISRKITNIYDEFLKPSNLNVTQYSLLSNLKRVQPIKMNDFSKVVKLDRTTLVRNLKPLINLSLIEIKSIDKSKAQLLELSQKGIELQNEGYKYWQKAQEYIEQTINHAELEIFYTIVKKMESLEIPKEKN